MGDELNVDCRLFRSWLDAGRPEAALAQARTHAASCEACAEEERLALELEAMLTLPPAPAPVGFTAHVMERVSATSPPVSAWPAASSLLPGWVRVAGEPACVLALIMAAFVIGPGHRLVSGSPAVVAEMRAILDALAARSPGFADPLAPLGLLIALAPLLWLVAQGLYGLSEGGTRRILRVSPWES